MPVTKGFEQLSPAEIAAEFMGLPEGKGSGERKKDTKTKERPKPKPKDQESEAEEEEEDAFKGKKGLRKRFNQLLKENPQLKRDNQTLREQLEALGKAPNTVLSPSANNPLSTAKTEEEVDSQAAQMLADTKAKLRWLNRHPDGGTWSPGTDQEREMSADEVDAAIEHYESYSASLEKAKTDRKAWLKTYGETAKVLGAESVSELTQPKVATRESELIKKVPELMRDPEFLQVLADARAGRELRDKKGKGIKFVEVKPPVKKGKEGKTAKPAKPEQRSKTREEKPKEAKPSAGNLTQRKLEQLRNNAQSGDRRSQAAIDAAFLG